MAFFITAFKDARNLEQLLRTVFRPHNAYCIHVDAKSGRLYRRTVEQLVACYRARHPGAQIFLSAESVPVYW